MSTEHISLIIERLNLDIKRLKRLYHYEKTAQNVQKKLAQELQKGNESSQVQQCKWSAKTRRHKDVE